MSDRDSASDVTVPRAGIEDAHPTPRPDRFIAASSPRVPAARQPGSWRVGVRTPPRPRPTEWQPGPPEPRTEPVVPTRAVPAEPLDVDDAPTVPLPVFTAPTPPPARPVTPPLPPRYVPTPYVAAPAPPRPPQHGDGLTELVVRGQRQPSPGRSARRGRKALSKNQYRRHALELERAVAAIPLRGPTTIAVVGGKGGIGKTTVAASLGTLLAELRPHDGVVAVDADTAFGKLGNRVDPRAVQSFQRLRAATGASFVDVRNTLGHNAAGLSVCVGGPPEPSGILAPELYRGAMNLLKRHFALSIVDCSTVMDAPITAEVLRGADAVVVVSSPWGDGAEVAVRTVEWMWVRGMHDLVNRCVVAVNDTDGHAVDAGVSSPPMLPHAYTVVVPFDRGLRSGTTIEGSQQFSAATRLSFLEIAKAVLDRVGGHPPR